jgi:hypothetical protein
MRHGLVLLALACAGGCVSFAEDHYYQSVTETGAPNNFFRLRVEGGATLSKARYVAGYYDERAVDLFFSEIKSDEPWFGAEPKEPGSKEAFKPLSPDEGHGAFVMIFSTSAKAVADTIGQFAENQLVADALTNLLNRSTVREAAATEAGLAADQARATALAKEIDGHFADALQVDASKPTEVQEAYLRILNVIARELGSSQTFGKLEEARAWFDMQRRVRGRGD